jgi:NitT/TauT family transport system permease protein
MKNRTSILRSPYLLGALLVLLLWQTLSLIVNSRIVPGPIATFAAFFRLLAGPLARHILYSILRITAALLASMGLGVPLGLWMGLSRRADAVLSPLAYILYPLPKVAFLPLFMLIFGLGDVSKVVLIFSIVIFQVVLAVRDGVKEIPGDLFVSMASIGLNRRQTYANLVFPAALPKILTALRVSIGVSIATLFFSENYATTYGLGYFIMNGWVMADYTAMFAGMLAMSLLGIGLFQAVDWAEKKICPWLRAGKGAASAFP